MRRSHKTKRKTITFSLKNINKILKTNPHLKEVFEKKESLVVLENEKTKSSPKSDVCFGQRGKKGRMDFSLV